MPNLKQIYYIDLADLADNDTVRATIFPPVEVIIVEHGMVLNK